MQICPSFCQKFPVSPDPAGPGPQSYTLYRLMSHCLLVCKVRPEVSGTVGSANHKPGFVTFSQWEGRSRCWPGTSHQCGQAQFGKNQTSAKYLCNSSPARTDGRSLETGRGEAGRLTDGGRGEQTGRRRHSWVWVTSDKVWHILEIGSNTLLFTIHWLFCNCKYKSHFPLSVYCVFKDGLRGYGHLGLPIN